MATQDRGAHVLGVRHHGPATARAVLARLQQLQPDCVLVEGPPEGDALLGVVADPEMRPPVAIMVCLPDEPGNAAFWPFAHWSPEWQALRWAAENEVPARFMDLPFTARRTASERTASEDAAGEGAPTEPQEPEGEHPLRTLDRAAAAPSGESWWDAVIEHRSDVDGLFEAVLHAMQEARPDPLATPNAMEAQREAYMRRSLRQACTEHETVVAICGAWHAPALVAEVPKSHDDRILKGLSRRKALASWAPWTPRRLASWSGYGAGVESPGWYDHLWRFRTASPAADAGQSDPVVIRWISRAAALLRAEGFDASAASVIESVRLSEALAALRGLPAPTLPELREAIRTVLCGGYTEPMAVIGRELEVGSGLGQVPSEGPAVPLQQDLARACKRLRLKPQEGRTDKRLDLRKDLDRQRSQLLWRLNALDIPWGKIQEGSRGSGTFREEWALDWDVEFAARVVEAAMWGHTVADAAAATLAVQGGRSDDLSEIVSLLDTAVLSGLPDAVDSLLDRTNDVAAASADLASLLGAVPGLARLARYGDVRGTDPARVLPIVQRLMERILAGLRLAVVNLEEEAADSVMERIAAVHTALATLDQAELRDAWRSLLASLGDDDGVESGVRGRMCRLLLEDGWLDAEQLEQRARLSLSTAHPPLAAARWLSGLLGGSGLVLLHHDGLWHALDVWMRALPEEPFRELLPMLRRAFSSFTRSERRSMAELVGRLGARPAGAPATADSGHPDLERGALVLPILAQLLGAPLPSEEAP